jgi:hypothetical protein
MLFALKLLAASLKLTSASDSSSLEPKKRISE